MDRSALLKKAIASTTKLIALTEEKLALLRQMLKGFEYELEKEARKAK